MKTLMDKEGLPYNMRTYSYNSRLAQELGKWAEEKTNDIRIHDALFRAYFVDNDNLAKPEVLLKVAEQLNLPIEEAREVLASRLFRSEIDDDWKRCNNLGVTGVPTFQLAGEFIVGAQPFEVLERFIRQVNGS